MKKTIITITSNRSIGGYDCMCRPHRGRAYSTNKHDPSDAAAWAVEHGQRNIPYFIIAPSCVTESIPSELLVG